MKWTDEAEQAIKKVPFFVRKRVKTRVENEAADKGKNLITISEVKSTQKNFLNKMSSEIKGYQIDTCFGQNGCPNKANSGDNLLKKIEQLLKKEDLLGFLKQNVKGDLKFHHEFRVTIADCPNACSQPQIKDIGIIGASKPGITIEECTKCNLCVVECKEGAIKIDKNKNAPDIDFGLCILCGQCSKVCPTGTIEEENKGFKILLGGKLGRHPRLATELTGIYSEDHILDIVKKCLKLYKNKSTNGKRFAEIVKSEGIESFIKNGRKA
ncbi:MAG: 4Fe-4S binding protein [Desulfobacteraceae bacterium]|nr:4Fe-4S binding protein [Desulfobacteraceae bacterium]